MKNQRDFPVLKRSSSSFLASCREGGGGEGKGVQRGGRGGEEKEGATLHKRGSLRGRARRAAFEGMIESRSSPLKCPLSRAPPLRLPTLPAAFRLASLSTTSDVTAACFLREGSGEGERSASKGVAGS